jgi:hypothetical protein
MDTSLNETNFQKNLELFHHFNPKASIMLPYVDCSETAFTHTQAKELNLQKTIGDEIFYYHSPKLKRGFPNKISKGLKSYMFMESVLDITTMSRRIG